jgi:HlyD family secretion protein
VDPDTRSLRSLLRDDIPLSFLRSLLRDDRLARIALGALLLAAACRSDTTPDAYGSVEATEVVVATEAGGQLESFTPVEGARLAKGATVAIVDSTTLALQLQQTAAQRTASASRVEEATRQIGVLEVQRTIALRDYERMQRLFAVQAATAQQRDQAERGYRMLVAQIGAARAARQSAVNEAASTEARVAQVREQLGKSRVTNPLSGTVLTTYARAGEVVQAGQPLYKIANLDTMELRAYVTEPQLALVKIGQSALVSVDLGDDEHRTLNGTVSWIASQAEFTPTPIVTRDERTNLVYAVKVRIPNRDGVLKIGMPADVQFPSLTAS